MSRRIHRIVSTGITYVLLLQSQFMAVLLSVGKIKKYTTISVLVILWHTLLVGMAVWTHWISMVTNPGLVPKLDEEQIATEPSKFEYCNKCSSLRPLGSHHCKRCKRCILRMDHHCPWISNCVGMLNQKFFILFLVYIFLLAITDITMVIFHLRTFILDDNWCYNIGKEYLVGKGAVIIIMIAIFSSLLFGVFTLIMCIDQVVAIRSNRTPIDKFKKIQFNRLGFAKTLVQVFGSPFSILWLVPVRMSNTQTNGELSTEDFLALVKTMALKNGPKTEAVDHPGGMQEHTQGPEGMVSTPSAELVPLKEL
ncbi:zinc finger protein DHHC domain containing protein [Theileria equi strain WA]|uniref:Palmitoyltransferase n=1 Tax=Theileria equi strain WA TaxID=1537102 RepID=L0AY69_THEEQ|nr:zinc finger protein DHHC domain containing protein [Theileria equi strain WA]AFZ79849.1 zinc finger protein DHHC domain containing protein [Theileria equi strain WA]|eukprot:XP_004829515.1 zinc finger protein DHHC domain containing protein [Theileria equi strain WA]